MASWSSTVRNGRLAHNIQLIALTALLWETILNSLMRAKIRSYLFSCQFTCDHIMSCTYSSLRVVGMSSTAASRSFILYASSSSCANTRRTQRNIPDMDQHFPTSRISVFLLNQASHNNRDKYVSRLRQWQRTIYAYDRRIESTNLETVRRFYLRPG
jgi:hypothetical protein